MKDDQSLVRSKFANVRSSKLFILIVVDSAVFTDAYLYGLIIPVLPFALVDRVNLHPSEVQQWIGILLGAYGAGLLVGSPIAGWLADRGDSRRGPYLWGLIALAASTLAFALGRTRSVLFVGRLVQGASSAVVHVVGMSILADTAGQKDTGLAMGFVTMCIALGVVLGPMLGGILYHNFGYAAVFISAYSLVALDLLLRILMLPDKDKSPQEAALKPDVQTYGTFSSNDGDTVEPATPKPDRKMRQSSLSSSITASSDESLPLRSQRWTQKTVHRNHILILLSSPRMLAAIVGDFMQSVVLTGLESILPLRIKTLFHYNSMEVALVFLLLALPAFAAPAIGYLSDRVGAKVVICLGFLFVAPFLVLLRLVDHYETSQVVILCILLFLTGVSLNMILTPAWSEAVYVVDEKEANTPGIFGAKGAYAQAFGLMNVAYAAGSLAGPLLGGLLVERVGWNNLTLATGIVCALCTLPCLYATGGRRPREPAMVVEGGEEDGEMGPGDG